MRAALPEPRRPLVAFLVVALVHVVAVGTGLDPLAVATKPFIVGLLIAWVVMATDRRPPVLLVVGLVFALLGDELLEVSGTLWFLLGMAAFLVMQLCYVAGFVRMGAGERLRADIRAAVLWLLLWTLLNVGLGPSLGELRWPILVYSLALTVMAATAVATGERRLGIGGVLFLVSDLMIGLRAAGTELPAAGVLVMATYAAAQFLIATGWVLAMRGEGLERVGSVESEPASG